MWRAVPLRVVFTLYSPMGARRINLICTTKELSEKRTGVETVAAAFTDHISAVMRLSVDVPIVRRGQGFWKMNTAIFGEDAFKERKTQKWAVWWQQRRFHPDWPMSWGRYTKKQIHLFCIQKESERRRDFVKMEKFLCECIYDVLRNTYPHGQKIILLNHLKTKITSLHGDKRLLIMLDNDKPNRLVGERPTLFDILQMRKRQEARIIRSIQDECGNIQQTTKGII